MRLKVSTEFEPLLDLESQQGYITVHFVKEDLQSAVQRWLDHGLHEWVSLTDDGLAYDKYDHQDMHPRSTLANQPEFIPRLKNYLQRQFSFTYELIE